MCVFNNTSDTKIKGIKWKFVNFYYTLYMHTALPISMYLPTHVKPGCVPFSHPLFRLIPFLIMTVALWYVYEILIINPFLPPFTMAAYPNQYIHPSSQRNTTFARIDTCSLFRSVIACSYKKCGERLHVETMRRFLRLLHMQNVFNMTYTIVFDIA